MPREPHPVQYLFQLTLMFVEYRIALHPLKLGLGPRHPKASGWLVAIGTAHQLCMISKRKNVVIFSGSVVLQPVASYIKGPVAPVHFRPPYHQTGNARGVIAFFSTTL